MRSVSAAVTDCCWVTDSHGRRRWKANNRQVAQLTAVFQLPSTDNAMWVYSHFPASEP